MATEPEVYGPALPADSAAEHFTHLVDRFYTRAHDLLVAFTSMDFYIEIAYLAVVLVLARFIAKKVRRRILAAIQKRPIRRLDPEFIAKPLSLLRPVIALFLFMFGKISFELSDISSGWLDAAIQLTTAYIMAKCVLLVVHTKPVARFIAWVIMISATIKAMHFMRSVTGYLDALSFDLGNFHISVLGILHGVVVLVVVFWLATALSQTLESYLRRSTALSYNAREIAVKCFKIFVYFIALFITLTAMGVDLTAFAVFGGALGVGVGLGLQKLTSNFVSSVTLLLEKSIRINDLIEVAGYTGHVRKLNTRYALIETADGREVMIPNEVMVSTNLTNWTHTTSQTRIEIRVSVDFDSDVDLAYKLILEAAVENSHSLKDPVPACYMKDFTDNGIAFILNFWIADVQKGRATPQSEVMFAIVHKFAKAGIRMSRPAIAETKPQEKEKA